MRYFHKHLLIALAIDLVGLILGLSFLGGMFYIGREIRDREKLGFWDWKGLLWPVIGSGLLFVFVRLI
jgi:hypothetical protein